MDNFKISEACESVSEVYERLESVNMVIEELDRAVVMLTSKLDTILCAASPTSPTPEASVGVSCQLSDNIYSTEFKLNNVLRDVRELLDRIRV